MALKTAQWAKKDSSVSVKRKRECVHKTVTLLLLQLMEKIEAKKTSNKAKL